jgi:hypothetical protein
MPKSPEPIHWFWLLPTAVFAVGVWAEQGWVIAVACIGGGLGFGFLIRYRAARRPS